MDESEKRGVIGGKFDREREAFEDEANRVFFKAMVSPHNYVHLNL